MSAGNFATKKPEMSAGGFISGCDAGGWRRAAHGGAGEADACRASVGPPAGSGVGTAASAPVSGGVVPGYERVSQPRSAPGDDDDGGGHRGGAGDVSPCRAVASGRSPVVEMIGDEEDRRLGPRPLTPEGQPADIGRRSVASVSRAGRRSEDSRHMEPGAAAGGVRRRFGGDIRHFLSGPGHHSKCD